MNSTDNILDQQLDVLLERMSRGHIVSEQLRPLRISLTDLQHKIAYDSEFQKRYKNAVEQGREVRKGYVFPIDETGEALLETEIE